MQSPRALIRQRNSQRRALNCPVLPSVEVRQASPAVTAAPERAEHPAITTTHPTLFRVLRPYFFPVFSSDSVFDSSYELIGEFRDEQEAIAFCKTEKHRAIVANGRTNKMCYANEGAVMEKESR